MLARKSRIKLVEKKVVKYDLLKTTRYIRLSDTIENQMKIIEDYTNTNLDTQFEQFYIDNNKSDRDFIGQH